MRLMTHLGITLLVLPALAQDGLTDAQKWIYGVCTGVGVSLLGFLAAIFLVTLKKCFSEDSFKVLVNFFYSLGCGALLADAIVHILPESFATEGILPAIVSLIFIVCIIFFLILERIFHSCGIAHSHWGDENHCTPKADSSEQPIQVEGAKQKKLSQQIKVISKEQDQVKSLQQSAAVIIEEKKEKSCLQNLKGKGISGYLNLVSSFIHNFMDGFGIGVGFASGSSLVYIPILVAVFVHEIPREMADVAILMKNGFSGVQTILCNGVINLMSLLGVLLGLGIGNLNQLINSYVMVIVAANFVYIAADIWRQMFKNTQSYKNVFEFIGFSLGVGAMYLVLLIAG